MILSDEEKLVMATSLTMAAKVTTPRLHGVYNRDSTDSTHISHLVLLSLSSTTASSCSFKYISASSNDSLST